MSARDPAGNPIVYMASGGIFSLIAGDGKADRILLAEKILRVRLAKYQVVRQLVACDFDLASRCLRAVEEYERTRAQNYVPQVRHFAQQTMRPAQKKEKGNAGAASLRTKRKKQSMNSGR